MTNAPDSLNRIRQQEMHVQQRLAATRLAAEARLAAARQAGRQMVAAAQQAGQQAGAQELDQALQQVDVEAAAWLATARQQADRLRQPDAAGLRGAVEQAALLVIGGKLDYETENGPSTDCGPET